VPEHLDRGKKRQMIKDEKTCNALNTWNKKWARAKSRLDPYIYQERIPGRSGYTSDNRGRQKDVAGVQKQDSGSYNSVWRAYWVQTHLRFLL